MDCHWTPAGLCTERAVLTCLCHSYPFCDDCYAAHAERAARQVAAGLYSWRGRWL